MADRQDLFMARRRSGEDPVEREREIITQAVQNMGFDPFDFEDIIFEAPQVVIPTLEWLLLNPLMATPTEREALRIVIDGARHRFYGGTYLTKVAEALTLLMFRTSLPQEALADARSFKSFFKVLQRAFCRQDLNRLASKYRNG